MEKTLNAIKHDLRQHYGSQVVYHGMIKKSSYTEGFKAYLEACNCYWLYDIIQSEFYNTIRKHKPDNYYISVITKKGGTIIMLQDYKENILYTRVVKWSTHPEGEINFEFGWDGNKTIICLPSEN